MPAKRTDADPRPSPERPPGSEREETDQSLHAERLRTDEEVRKRAEIERSADAALQHARERADHVLDTSRRRADATLAGEGSSDGQRRVIRHERAQADDTVRQERLDADEELADERQAGLRAIAELFLLERGQTDDRLLVERARGDADLAARNDFMAMAAHDLRTLLNTIALSADLQVKNATDDETGRRILGTAEKIRRTAAKMNRLIGDLVDVASIEAQRFAVLRSDLDAGALIREAVEAFRPAASASGIALEATSTEGARALGDHDRTFQVLANLLSNAIKWTPRGGTIAVRVAKVGSEVRFSVTDTGAGIPRDHVESIFERFWQVTHDRRGHGLGLFISASIVEAQGGRIWVESELGQGSTFFFTLPANAPPDAG